LPAHPLSKGLVMWQQRWVISTLRKTLSLRFGSGVQQAHRERVEPLRRWGGDYLGSGHRITCEQQVSPRGLEFDSPAHGQLCRLLTPDPRHRLGRRREIQELHALNFWR